MHCIVILLVFTLAEFAQGINSSLSRKWKSSWIMGGFDAPPGEYPFMVSLRATRDSVHFCGGSIISSRYILTAAHCVDRSIPSPFIAVVGTNELSHPGQRYRISQITLHPAFERSTLKSDIALVKVVKPIVFSATVRPVTLPSKEDTPAPRARCLLLGWGKKHPTARNYPNKLQQLQVSIISTSECWLYYPDLQDTKLCALAGPGNGAATGDSGGPLIFGGKQVGLYSGGGTPGKGYSAPFPMIFTSLPLHVEWIKQQAM